MAVNTYVSLFEDPVNLISIHLPSGSFEQNMFLLFWLDLTWRSICEKVNFALYASSKWIKNKFQFKLKFYILDLSFSRCLIRWAGTYWIIEQQTYLWKKSSIDSMVWSMLLLLLQIPSLSRKQGSLTTDSRESCLMMLFSLSVLRFWYISWLRSWRKWFTLGLVGLPGSPPVLPRPWAGLVDMESSQPLARSRQQLQQSRPMGERQSSSDILTSRWMKRKDAQGRCRNFCSGSWVCEW